VVWKAERGQLNLAYEKNEKKKTKTNKREDSPNGTRKSTYGGKNLWNRWVLGLTIKTEGVTDGESEDKDCEEVMYAR